MPARRMPAGFDARRDQAMQALACLDLTSLNDGDDAATVAALCARADGRHGPVAAVCVWPTLARVARSRVAAGLTLKVILETGELPGPAQIHRAATLALDAGADFLKTSTGKKPVGATEAAVRVMLQAISAHPRGAASAGIKVSGGVRTLDQAARYMDLVRAYLGPHAVVPARFRIGASGLLDDIERQLDGVAGGSATTPTDAY